MERERKGKGERKKETRRRKNEQKKLKNLKTALRAYGGGRRKDMVKYIF
jgi:hypothetical protein